MMGSGVAITAIRVAQLETQIICENEKAALMSRSFIEGWAQKEIERGRMKLVDKYNMLRKLSFSLDISDARTADFVIEAVPENFELKK